jgi:hypothetical protein
VLPLWQSELESFLVEITASIFKKKDEQGEGWLIDKVLDKTGMKVRRCQGGPRLGMGGRQPQGTAVGGPLCWRDGQQAIATLILHHPWSPPLCSACRARASGPSSRRRS